jgi:predicted nucleic acid-binding protein
MGSPNRLTDPLEALIADTSAVINLNATGRAREILRVIPNRFLVVDVVSAELEQGRRRGRADADLLHELVAEGLVEIVSMDESAASHFERLVVGPASQTLDDGEATTIAYAASRETIVVIDERKATRLCAELFPATRISCTVDILAHPEIGRKLGQQALAEAVFNALQQGRMRVFPQHFRWVVELIGPVKAATCASLPKAVRQPHQNVSAKDVRTKNDAV